MYAISTPIDEQYRGDGIAIRGIAYDIHTLRVDGNDVFAVYNAVKEARELIVTKNRPVLIESMSYREGDHSTSDFSKMYRNEQEMQKWKEYLISLGNPIDRFYRYLENKNWITENERNDIITDAKEQVREALKNALKGKKPSFDSLFTDVYEDLTPNLIEQKEYLKQHVAKYPEVYQLDKFTDK
jgi:2-oxoisovalerate dehydrogenase E1 component alpha subunit